MSRSVPRMTGTATEPVDFTAVLMRPDGYVAWASSEDEPDTESLHHALSQWFGLTTPASAYR